MSGPSFIYFVGPRSRAHYLPHLPEMSPHGLKWRPAEFPHPPIWLGSREVDKEKTMPPILATEWNVGGSKREPKPNILAKSMGIKERLCLILEVDELWINIGKNIPKLGSLMQGSLRLHRSGRRWRILRKLTRMPHWLS